MQENKNTSIGKALGCLWGFFLIIVVVIGLFVVSLTSGIIGNIPDLSDLQNPINKSASRIYSDDGVMIGTWSYARENRLMVPYDSIPENMVHALVAVEDERFYEHSGIDYIALGRVAMKTIIGGNKSSGGGSTITQQLAKQLYTDVSKNFYKRMMQKPIEWYIAVQLERLYTKEEIIAMYLNYFDFLYSAVGIKMAAKTYFGKNTKDLNLSECATLVGMCKNPSYFNPRRHKERCTARRNVVLAKMEEQGYISAEQCYEVQHTPIDITNFHAVNHKEGYAPYFREHLRIIMMAERPNIKDYETWQYQQYHDDSLAWETDPIYGWCNKNTKKDGSHYNIYTDGLKIYTTVDTRMQKMAEEAMQQHVANYLQPVLSRGAKGKIHGPYLNVSEQKFQMIMRREMKKTERWRVMRNEGYSEEEIIKSFDVPQQMTLFSYKGDVELTMTPRDSILYYKTFLRSAMMAMDPHTGYVRAYVPGLDFDHFQYDNCLGGGRRQVGSTMKPLLYSLAMMNNYSPCDLISTAQFDFGGWKPKGGVGCGMITLAQALASSNNQASARLISKLNPHLFISLLHDMGIGTVDIDPGLSLCLGPCNISVGEMVSAYTIFSNKGIRVAPLLITKIEDSEGNLVAIFTPRVNEIMTPEQAYQMISMMRGVVNSGTGRAIRATYNISADIAGKTGTTNSNADAWFIGCTPNLVVGTWVGGDDPDIHFTSMAFGQGAKAALPIYAIFLKKVLAMGDKLGVSESDEFEEPEGFELCPDVYEGLAATSASSARRYTKDDRQNMGHENVEMSEPYEIDESFQ